jgi:ATP-dependent helicase/nuclease subunit A
VVLAGMLDREPIDKGLRWLMQWNAERDQIESAFLWRKSDPLPDDLLRALEDDERQSNDEDFNLLYVGITRAKECLLLSAAHGTDDGWYQQLSEFCELWLPDESPPNRSVAGGLSWRGLNLPKRVLHNDISQDSKAQLQTQSLAIRKGKALHRLLEFGPMMSESTAFGLMAEFALPRQARLEVIQAMQAIRDSAISKIVFGDALAYAEAEWPTPSGAMIRPDRVVRIHESPEEWWIIDFKWQLLDSERQAYASQLLSYQQTFVQIRPEAKVLAKILTASGKIFLLHEGQLVPDVH